MLKESWLSYIDSNCIVKTSTLNTTTDSPKLTTPMGFARVSAT